MAAAFQLVGCAWFGSAEIVPPVAVPTRVALNIEAATDVNPDGAGQGKPVHLRVYELRGASAFEGADFFAIYDRDQATLGADLAGKKELVIHPAGRKILMLEPAPGSQYLGIFAAYRQLDTARWRALVPVVPQRTSVVEIKLKGTSIGVETPAVAPLSDQAK